MDGAVVILRGRVSKDLWTGSYPSKGSIRRDMRKFGCCVLFVELAVSKLVELPVKTEPKKSPGLACCALQFH